MLLYTKHIQAIRYLKKAYTIRRHLFFNKKKLTDKVNLRWIQIKYL